LRLIAIQNLLLSVNDRSLIKICSIVLIIAEKNPPEKKAPLKKLFMFLISLKDI